MLENELKNLWQNSAENIKFNAERISNTYILEKNIEKFDRKLFLRNIRECVAALVVIVFLSYNIVFLQQNTIKNLADLAGITACIFVSYTLIKTRKEKANINSNLPVLDELELLKVYYKKEKWLLESIVIWYLLPFLPGLILASINIYQTKTMMFFLIYVIIGVMLNLFIWWINKQAAKKKFIPIINEIDSLIESWRNKL